MDSRLSSQPDFKEVVHRVEKEQKNMVKDQMKSKEYPSSPFTVPCRVVNISHLLNEISYMRKRMLDSHSSVAGINIVREID